MYRRALSAPCGRELEREQLWRRYQQAAAYAYVASTVTADIALAGLQQAVAAFDDLDTVATLRKVL